MSFALLLLNWVIKHNERNMSGFRWFKELGIQIRLAAREFAEGEMGLNIRKTELRVKAEKTKRDEGSFKKPADADFQMLIGFMAEIYWPATSIGGSGHAGSIPIRWVPFSPFEGVEREDIGSE